MSDSDFRNTYSVAGFCGVDPSSHPMFFSIHELANNATHFAISVEKAITCDFLKPSDVLAMDNAQVHSGWENEVLEHFLLEPALNSHTVVVNARTRLT
jgi:hypothetical protein